MLCASQTVEWKRREGPATSILLIKSSDCPWGLWVTGWISGVRDRVTMRRAGKTASSRLFHNLAPVCLVDLRLRPGAFWGDWTRQWTLLSCWSITSGLALTRSNFIKTAWKSGSLGITDYGIIWSNRTTTLVGLVRIWYLDFDKNIVCLWAGSPATNLWPLHVHYWHKKWHYKWSLRYSDPFDPLDRA